MARLRLAPALILLVLVAGCGGGGSSSSTASGSGKVLPPATWVKRTDAVCTAATPRNEEIQQKIDETSEEALTEDLSSGMSDAIGEAGDELRRVADQIKAIPPPKGQEDAASELVESLEGVAANFDSLSGDLTDSDESGTEEDEQEGEEVQASVRRLAHRLGLKVCGSSD